MGIRLPSILLNAKQIFRMQSVSTRSHSNIPKGHIAVYVGEIRRKRFVVSVSYLNHPSFLSLLNRAEEEFGFNHSSGGLTIPCKEYAFMISLQDCIPLEKNSNKSYNLPPKASGTTYLFILVLRESK